MTTHRDSVYVGNNPYQSIVENSTGKKLLRQGQSFYCIENFDAMPPFFISLVSSSDHWMFISSTGGLTAGRMNADSALFPYETVDKITEHAEFTGSKTIFRITREGKTYLWEPFSIRFQGQYQTQRNLYKNLAGTQLIFEEINLDLAVSYQYSWSTSDQFGFIKTASIENHSPQPVNISVLDGVQYLLPYGVPSETQNIFSNLLTAYKRSELDPETGIGMYTLSSTLSDMPEANESLMATTAWQWGLTPKVTLLSTRQLEHFRENKPLTSEYDLRGERGAYFVESDFSLEPAESKDWHFILEVNQDISTVIELKENLLQDPNSLWQQADQDILTGNLALRKLVANADGLQCTGDGMVNTHHFANTLFNIMRGGIFDDNYVVHKRDFVAFLDTHNRQVKRNSAELIQALPQTLNISELLDHGKTSASPDFLRLCYEYLPLTFSRRHGDPSRPWNRFSINLKNPDGTRKLDFQGNWRDIFQNWEPLAVSFPEFIENMITKFLNATTGDGYNPYRLTFSGFEWEIPNPDDPWGNIGYWGDHQIIYLQKLLELSQQFHPGALTDFLHRPIFVHANVPYRIKPFKDILADWHNTIDFDRELNTAIDDRVSELGSDGKLLMTPDGEILHSTMTEKLLNLLLAKVVNFIPEGGIWMNTQRPEWNDANNALAGKGISVVTTAYLYRYLRFFQKMILESDQTGFVLSAPLTELFQTVNQSLNTFQTNLAAGFNPAERFAFMRTLGEAGNQYRQAVYDGKLSSGHNRLPANELQEFLYLLETYLGETLRANRRSDGLYHAYNVLKIAEETAEVENLSLMLEGQVAILSSGYLSSQEAVSLLKTLRQSDLYRPDQHSYILYPDRDLAGFLSKNIIPPSASGLQLFQKMIQNTDQRLVSQDVKGGLHFSGLIHNDRDVKRILNDLAEEPQYAELIARERTQVLAVFEQVFNHSAFTGRSGTFFGYEGLGSVYWHMVTKLLLAVQENYWPESEKDNTSAISQELCTIYYDIRDGIGFNKTPSVYGSFPTDPYSHTPKGAGAKQPGMTGQVKEELMARWRELGVVIKDGKLSFSPNQLLEKEFLTEKTKFTYFDLTGKQHPLNLPEGSLAFTFCQVPIIYQRGEENLIHLHFKQDTIKTIHGNVLSAEDSQHIFKRTGDVCKIEFFLKR